MLDSELYIEETAGRTNVVTFLTDGFEDVEAMGFEVAGGLAREEWEALEQELQPLLDIPEDRELEQREVEDAEQQELRAHAGDVHAGGDLQPGDDGQVQDLPLQPCHSTRGPHRDWRGDPSSD